MPVMRYPIPEKVRAIVEIFHTLPGEAVVNYQVAEVITDLHTKTLRNHPLADKRRPSKKREGLTVNSVRLIASEKAA
jgi:hypothetical protein